MINLTKNSDGPADEPADVDAKARELEREVIRNVTAHVIGRLPHDPGAGVRRMLGRAEVVEDAGGRGWCIAGGDGRHYLGSDGEWHVGLEVAEVFYSTSVDARAVLFAERRADAEIARDRAVYLEELGKLPVGNELEPGIMFGDLIRMSLATHPARPAGDEEGAAWLEDQVRVTMERISFQFYEALVIQADIENEEERRWGGV